MAVAARRRFASPESPRNVVRYWRKGEGTGRRGGLRPRSFVRERAPPPGADGSRGDLRDQLLHLRGRPSLHRPRADVPLDPRGEDDLVRDLVARRVEEADEGGLPPRPPAPELPPALAPGRLPASA